MRCITFATALTSFSTGVKAIAILTRPPAFSTPHLQDRAATTALSTCGFLNGNPSKPWVAPHGFNCRVDTLHGIWGFCPTSVIAATDCGLGGYCFDNGPCSKGCGRESLRNNPKVVTWTCPEADDNTDAKFCSTGTLIFGPDQTYDYVDCARNRGRATFFVSPTPISSTTSTVSTTSLSQPSRSDTTLQPTPTATASRPPPGYTPAAESSSKDNNNNSDGGGINRDNTGAIVGGILGGLALLLGSVVAIVYLLRNDRARQQDTNQNEETLRGKPNVSGEGWKYPAAGWELAELEGMREQAPGESPAYHPGPPTAMSPAELPTDYGR